MLFHRCEVVVVVKQRMTEFDAKCSDDDVGGLSNRDTEAAELPIIASGGHGKRVVQQSNHRIAAQIALDSGRVTIISRPLQDLEQDQVTDQERFSCHGRSQLGGGGGIAPPEM